MDRIKENVIPEFVLIEFFTLFATVAAMVKYREYDALFKVSFIIGGLCTAGFGWFYISRIIKRHEWDRVYLGTGLIMGLVFMLIIPIYCVPDEYVHLAKAYQLSNKMMFIDSDDASIKMRRDDAKFPYVLDYNSVEELESYYEYLPDDLSDEEIAISDKYSVKGYDYQYLFSALGIMIGRIFGFGSGLTFLLGRFLNLVFFVLLYSVAIKKTPIGKTIFFGCGLIPTMIQQAASFSYDVLINGMSAVVIAYTLKIVYNYEVMSKKEWVTYVAAASLLSMSKSMAYILVAFMPALALVFYLKRDNLIVKRLLLALGIIFFMSVGLWLYPRLVVTGVDNITGIVGDIGVHYTIGKIISSPFTLPRLILNTLGYNLSWYVMSLLGEQLGWFNIISPSFFTYGWIIILTLLCFKNSSEFVIIRSKEKLGFFAVVLFTIVFIFGGFLLITPDTSETIQGVQGRYFLPIMPLGMILLMTKKNVVDSKFTENVIIFEMFWLIFMIFGILFIGLASN